MVMAFLRKLRGLGASEAWQEQLRPLEQRAFALAQARWQAGAPLAETAVAEARDLQRQLRALAADMHREDPAAYDDLSPLLSEALLDVNYALTAPGGVSLRLHHYIEAQEARNQDEEQ